MSTLDAAVLAERTARVERHLRRVAACLPDDPAELLPETNTTDAVVLHLWQATQIVIDLATSSCVRLGLGTPASYADAFVRLAAGGHVDDGLACRLSKAAGFRNIVAHAYDTLDLALVHQIALVGPQDLRAFLVTLRDL